MVELQRTELHGHPLDRQSLGAEELEVEVGEPTHLHMHLCMLSGSELLVDECRPAVRSATSEPVGALAESFVEYPAALVRQTQVAQGDAARGLEVGRYSRQRDFTVDEVELDPTRGRKDDLRLVNGSIDRDSEALPHNIVGDIDEQCASRPPRQLGPAVGVRSVDSLDLVPTCR